MLIYVVDHGVASDRLLPVTDYYYYYYYYFDGPYLTFFFC